MRYIDEQLAYEQYDEAIDEQGTIKIGYLQFSPSRILKELDPIAYRCGFADWLDACNLTIDESESDADESDADESDADADADE